MADFNMFIYNFVIIKYRFPIVLFYNPAVNIKKMEILNGIV